MRSINLSASSIKGFLSCSQSYYYRINYPESAIQTPSMKIGTAIHNLLESAYGNTPEVLYKSGEASIKELNLSKRDYKYGLEKLNKCMVTYFHYFNHLVYEDDLIETNFKLLLEDNIYVVGRIDRLNVERGTVIDWKTSYKDPLFINTDVQFLLYKYAFQRLYNKMPTLVLYANLFTGKLLSLNDKDNVNYNMLIDDIIPYIISRIKNNEFYREGIEKGICNRCPYRNICLDTLEK